MGWCRVKQLGKDDGLRLITRGGQGFVFGNERCGAPILDTCPTEHRFVARFLEPANPPVSSIEKVCAGCTDPGLESIGQFDRD